MNKITETEFQPFIEQSGKVAVFFGAATCPGCRLAESWINKLDKTIPIVKYDIGENGTDLVEGFGIRKIPAALIYQDGELVETVMQFVPATLIEKHFSA